MSDQHDIGWAVAQMKAGSAVRRGGWAGKDALRIEQRGGGPTIVTRGGEWAMLAPSDVLATDWELGEAGPWE